MEIIAKGIFRTQSISKMECFAKIVNGSQNAPSEMEVIKVISPHSLHIRENKDQKNIA